MNYENILHQGFSNFFLSGHIFYFDLPLRASQNFLYLILEEGPYAIAAIDTADSLFRFKLTVCTVLCFTKL